MEVFLLGWSTTSLPCHQQKINRNHLCILLPISPRPIIRSLAIAKPKTIKTKNKKYTVAYIESRRAIAVLWNGSPATPTAHAALSQLDHEGQRRVGRRSQAAQQARQGRWRRYQSTFQPKSLFFCLSQQLLPFSSLPIYFFLFHTQHTQTHMHIQNAHT